MADHGFRSGKAILDIGKSGTLLVLPVRCLTNTEGNDEYRPNHDDALMAQSHVTFNLFLGKHYCPVC